MIWLLEHKERSPLPRRQQESFFSVFKQKGYLLQERFKQLWEDRGRMSGTDDHILVLKLFFLHEKLCAIWGKNLWTYNIENHLVSAHSCQQMRNSFLSMPWEEELPQQALQHCRVWLATDTALALQGQDTINFPMKKKKNKPAELHRKSRKRSGAWELNGCSRSGPFSWQAENMKGAQESSVLLLTEQWIKANKRRQNSIKTRAGACIIIVLSYLMLCQNPLPLSPGASHR